jgi:microcystin-dependent protein
VLQLLMVDRYQLIMPLHVQVWRHWSRGSVSGLLDGCSADGLQPSEMLRFIHVALLCVQEAAHLRPGMAAVVVMLNSRSITLPVPTAPPAYLVPSYAGALGRSRTHEAEIPAGAVREPSCNDASISYLEPRWTDGGIAKWCFGLHL